MTNVFSMFRKSAENDPEKVFISDRGRTLTYKEVYKKACSLGRYLSDTGLGAGDRVLLYLDNSVDYIEAFYAVLSRDGIVIPVNKNLTTEVIEHIALETSPIMIITNTIFKKRLTGTRAADACQVINLDVLDSLPDTARFVSATADENSPALILYTSGTTKLPKGVTLTHKNLLANTSSIVFLPAA